MNQLHQLKKQVVHIIPSVAVPPYLLYLHLPTLIDGGMVRRCTAALCTIDRRLRYDTPLTVVQSSMFPRKVRGAAAAGGQRCTGFGYAAQRFLNTFGFFMRPLVCSCSSCGVIENVNFFNIGGAVILRRTQQWQHPAVVPVGHVWVMILYVCHAYERNSCGIMRQNSDVCMQPMPPHCRRAGCPASDERQQIKARMCCSIKHWPKIMKLKL